MKKGLFNHLKLDLKLFFFFFLIINIILGALGIRLQACSDDGTLETQLVELHWDSISQWEADDEAMAFCLQYHRQQSDKNPRWLKIFTPYVSIISYHKF